MKLKNDTIVFLDDVARDEAIEVLSGRGLKGVDTQKNKPTLNLKFVDEKTAKDAYDILHSKLKESNLQRLQKLAGIQITNESISKGMSPDELYQEMLAQYKNLEVFKPRNAEELFKTADAIIGSAQDLIKAVELLKQAAL